MYATDFRLLPYCVRNYVTLVELDYEIYHRLVFIRDYNANFISESFFNRQEFSVFSQKDCQGSLNLETRWKIGSSK